MSLSIIDDIILKIIDNDVGNIPEKNHDLRENILYMPSIEKTFRDEQHNIRTDEFDENNTG